MTKIDCRVAKVELADGKVIHVFSCSDDIIRDAQKREEATRHLKQVFDDPVLANEHSQERPTYWGPGDLVASLEEQKPELKWFQLTVGVERTAD